MNVALYLLVMKHTHSDRQIAKSYIWASFGGVLTASLHEKQPWLARMTKCEPIVILRGSTKLDWHKSISRYVNELRFEQRRRGWSITRLCKPTVNKSGIVQRYSEQINVFCQTDVPFNLCIRAYTNLEGYRYTIAIVNVILVLRYQQLESTFM